MKHRLIIPALAAALILAVVPVSAKPRTFYSDKAYADELVKLNKDTENGAESLTIDTATGRVYLPDGKAAEAYDRAVEKAAKKEKKAAKKALKEDGYSIEGESGSKITVKNPYRTKRILYTGKLPEGISAKKVIRYGDEYVLQFDTEEETINCMEKLEDMGMAANATPDMAMELFETNVSTFSLAGSGSDSWGVPAMKLDDLQTKAGESSGQVIVAVIDSGCTEGNPYFSGRLMTGMNATNGTTDVSDADGHGTHVAGIICDGTPDNIKVYPVKAADGSGTITLTSIRAGITYAINAGAKVINLSLGVDDPNRTISYLDSVISQAVNAGCVVVAAAGNSAKDATYVYPANNGNVCCVSAIDSNRVFDSSYSNYGSVIDYAAPGTNIRSTYGSGLALLSGTSMAAPHISAAFADLLLMDPDLNVTAAGERLDSYCTDLGDPGWDPYYGKGMPVFAGLYCTHAYQETGRVNASCIKEGSITYTCSLCGDSYTDPIEKTDHTPRTLPAVSATCTSTGLTEGKSCQVCALVLTEQQIIPITHKVTTNTMNPTCSKEGWRKESCSLCGYYNEIILPKKDHTPVTDPAVSATCTTPGKTEGSHCSVCNTVITAQQTIPAGHDLAVTTTEATCTNTGKRTEACKNCSYINTVILPKKNHTVVMDAAVDATCAATGLTEGSHCSVCSTILKARTVTEKTSSHTWDGGVVKRTASCSEAGEKIYTCGICSATKTESIPAAGHTFTQGSYIPATCTAAGSSEKVCSVCGEKTTTILPITGHAFGKEVQTASATVFQQGVMTKTCSRCGVRSSRVLAKASAYLQTNADSLVLKVKQKTTAFKVTGLGTGDRLVSMTSADPAVVKVNGSQLIAGKKAGKTLITLRTAAGVTKNIPVKVQKGTVKASSVRLNAKTIALKAGQSYRLTAQVSPITCVQKITYTSSKKKIAAVSSKGVINAKKKGTAKITVKCSGKKAVCTVKVY